MWVICRPHAIILPPPREQLTSDRIIEESCKYISIKILTWWHRYRNNSLTEESFVVIVQFEGDKLAHEHIYWDQASVLVQLGLLDIDKLPICGVEQAKKATDPFMESNGLINSV